MAVAEFLTDFADQAVLLPLAAVVSIVLVCCGWVRGGLVWVYAVGGALAAVLVSKIAFMACGDALMGSSIHSPSGHTAAASAIYGGVAGLTARDRSHRLRWAMLASLLISVVIGASRIVLRMHTGLEVVIGAVIGISAASAVAFWAGDPPVHMRSLLLAEIVVAAGLLLHGSHLTAESAIRTSLFSNVWPLSACVRR